MSIDDALRRAASLMAEASVETPPRWVMVCGVLYWFCEDCGEPLEIECDLSSWPTGTVSCKCGWSKDFEEDNR